MKPEQISAITEKAEPVALYPCGFNNLHRLVIEVGAFLARNLNEGEPVTDEIRSAAMVLVGYAKDMSSLLAKQPLYTHPAIEPKSAPLPDDVAKMVERLRESHCHEAADMIEHLARERDQAVIRRDEIAHSLRREEVERLARQVPPDCVVVPREPTLDMLIAAKKAVWASMIAAGEVK